MKNYFKMLSIFMVFCFLSACKSEPKFLGKWKYTFPNDIHIKYLTIVKGDKPDSYYITERYEIHTENLGLTDVPNISENKYFCFLEKNNCFVYEGHTKYCYNEHSNTISKNEKKGEIVFKPFTDK